VPERKEPSQLVGDALREMAVLILVFYCLETGIRGELTLWGFVFTFAACGGLLWWGIIFEGRDEQ